MQVTPASDPNTGHRGTARVQSHSYFYKESAEREDSVEDFGEKKKKKAGIKLYVTQRHFYSIS